MSAAQRTGDSSPDRSPDGPPGGSPDSPAPADREDGQYEYAPLRIPADVSGVNAAVRLALHAEYGGWELARVQRWTDGRRQVLLRRRRRAGADDVPLPGLIR